jgi:hypothetical protein
MTFQTVFKNLSIAPGMDYSELAMPMEMNKWVSLVNSYDKV